MWQGFRTVRAAKIISNNSASGNARVQYGDNNITNNYFAPKEKREDIIPKLTSADPSARHVQARLLRQEGTCQWIFTCDEFQAWLRGVSNELLWITATPGMGKTILASEIIDGLELLHPHPKGIGLAYFYCDYRNSLSQSLGQVFGCLVAQLTQQSDDIYEAAQEYLKTFEKTHVKTRSVDYRALTDLLLGTCHALDKIYLVLDAVDEFLPPSKCEADCHVEFQERRTLLETLSRLGVKSNGKIKVLVTSRPMTDVQSVLHKVPKIHITAKSNSEDIRLYLRRSLERETEKDTDWGSTILESASSTPSLMDRIVCQLVANADGMFLFATLQLHVLMSSDHTQDSETALQTLPSTMCDIWERLLLDIDTAQNEDRNREIVKRMLLWLVTTMRPMTIDELQAAMAIDIYEPHRPLPTRSPNEQWLLKLCGPLVRYNETTRELSLAHFSLKEFLVSMKLKTTKQPRLESYGITLQDAHEELAAATLTYISAKDFSRPVNFLEDLDIMRSRYRLLDYSVLHCGNHLTVLNSASDKIMLLLKALFAAELSWSDVGIGNEERERAPFDLTITVMLSQEITDMNFSRLSLTASFRNSFKARPDAAILTDRVASAQKGCINGHPNSLTWLHLFRMLSDWMREDHPANTTPLYFASLFGWVPGVRSLLRDGQNRATISDLNHALRAASVGGFPEVISMLHNSGADVNARLGDLGSPIQSAAWAGQKDAVATLRSLGASTAQDLPYRRPGGTIGNTLQGAAMNGDIELVRSLLESGADVNQNTGWLGTALQATVERGRDDIAHLLINVPNFRPDITGGYYGSASRILCLKPNNQMNEALEKLFDRGGDVNQRVGPYGNLLEIASHAEEERSSKVELLIARGAMINSFCKGVFGNAIHAATIGKENKTLPLLLRHGADPNCAGTWSGKEYATVATSLWGRILLLIEGDGFLAFRGMGLFAGFFAPALHAAGRIREAEHNKIFLQLEHEPTHRHGHLGRPLQAAAFHGNVPAIRTLVDHGARLDETSGFFGTALQAAVSQGHLEAVRTLLELGADPNPTASGHYGTPLAAAAALKFDSILEVLLNGGARMDHGDASNWTADTWRDLVSTESHESQKGTGHTAGCLLPRSWSSVNRSPHIEVDSSSNCVCMLSDSPLPVEIHGGTHLIPLAATIITDHPICPNKNFYFEITIEAVGDEASKPSAISIGLSERDIPSFRHPGTSRNRWGFRGDPGGCFQHEPHPDFQWPHGWSCGYHSDGNFHAVHVGGEALEHEEFAPFGQSDVIGCGVEWVKGVVFWTKNGMRLEPDVELVRCRMYPAVGMMRQGTRLRANFGEDKFLYTLGQAI